MTVVVSVMQETDVDVKMEVIVTGLIEHVEFGYIDSGVKVFKASDEFVIGVGEKVPERSPPIADGEKVKSVTFDKEEAVG